MWTSNIKYDLSFLHKSAQPREVPSLARATINPCVPDTLDQGDHQPKESEQLKLLATKYFVRPGEAPARDYGSVEGLLSTSTE